MTFRLAGILAGELRVRTSESLSFSKSPSGEVDRQAVYARAKLSPQATGQLDAAWHQVQERLDRAGWANVRVAELANAADVVEYRIIDHGFGRFVQLFRSESLEPLWQSEPQPGTLSEPVRAQLRRVQRALLLDGSSYRIVELTGSAEVAFNEADLLVQELREDLLRPRWDATRKADLLRSFDQLRDDERLLVLDRFALGVAQHRLVRDAHPLLSHELIIEGSYLECEMDDDDNDNREQLMEALDPEARPQLAEYWPNIEANLEGGSSYTVQVDSFLDPRDRSLRYRTFSGYIDGVVYLGNSTSVVGRCCQHRPDHKPVHRDAMRSIERARRIDGASEDVSFADLSKTALELPASEPMRALEAWLSASLARRFWDDKRKRSFETRFLMLPPNEQSVILDELAIGVLERRIGIEDYPGSVAD